MPLIQPSNWETPKVITTVKLRISGERILIDFEDEKKVKAHDWWYGIKAGVQTRFHGSRKLILLHRFLMSCPDGMIVDHINGDNRDNRRRNLRIATKSQNQHNRRKLMYGSSYFKGVSWHIVHQQWVAQIMVNNEQLFLGYFNSELEAAKAYNQAAKERHGEFAALNEINGKII